MVIANNLPAHSKIIFLSVLILLVITSCQQKPEHTEAKQLFTTSCAGCHGQQMQAMVDRKWKFGNSKEELIKSIANGHPDEGMPAFSGSLTTEQIAGLAAYIRDGIENVEAYRFEDKTLKTDTFKADGFRFHLDTVFSGIESPWGMTFLPNESMLITEKSGHLFLLDTDRKATEIKGVPEVIDRSQGGLMDVAIHPDYSSNGWVYLSYSGIRMEGDETLTSTVVSRYQLSGDSLTQRDTIFEALPYSTRRHHYGSRLVFDADGFLYVSVGDRGNRDENPQVLDNHCGKIHRLNADGSIPEDNPFTDSAGVMKSIFSYGNRNPQGMATHPETGELWVNEHGPRGGDEVNIIRKGRNYGWPVISYGLNYDGTTFTQLLEKEGMEQPVLYWVPSIAPSGMAFITTDKYPGWQGHLLVGSLRFKYLNFCELDGNEVVSEKKLMENIGRLRNVKAGPDGYIYVAVERPGFVFRLVPME